MNVLYDKVAECKRLHAQKIGKTLKSQIHSTNRRRFRIVE
jgi:hypothetical protein